MTQATIIIKDGEGEIHVEGHLDNPDAVNQPPTPALILSSYIAANMAKIVEDSGRWFFSQVAADAAAAESKEVSDE